MPQPTEEIFKTISRRFRSLWDFPNCIGAIDGKHVRIKASTNSGSTFFNYKDFHSVVMLALVDADNKFVAVDIGSYGREGDAESPQAVKYIKKCGPANPNNFIRTSSTPINTHQHPSTPINTHQHPATPGNTRQHPATPGNTRQHPATPGNTRQHPATRQHPPTPANTLPTPISTHQHPSTPINTHQHPSTPINIHQHPATPGNTPQFQI
ncbi:hypothetical protein JTB14_029579 [Gonioctena quinquepunctata]|nr:hypothetical protein JTB14_029579 [Gonioctena quinquepunctata]